MIISEQNKSKIQKLCLTYNVDKLYLFGSAANLNFTDESDIDLLVRFKKFDLAEYFLNYMALKDNLKEVFNRKIDLVVLTHPHADHVNGLVEIVRRFQVDHVLIVGSF